MGAEDRIVIAEVSADAGGDGLLADIGVAGTGDEASLVGFSELFFAAADDQHLAVEGQGDVFSG